MKEEHNIEDYKKRTGHASRNTKTETEGEENGAHKDHNTRQTDKGKGE